MSKLATADAIFVAFGLAMLTVIAATFGPEAAVGCAVGLVIGRLLTPVVRLVWARRQADRRTRRRLEGLR